METLVGDGFHIYGRSFIDSGRIKVLANLSKDRLNPWFFLFISIISGALGQLAMKAGMLEGWQTPEGMIWVFTGIACYSLAMLVWIYVLSSFSLSFAYPLLSLGYVLVYLGAGWWPLLNEEFSVEKTLGIICIVIGVLFITTSSARDKI